MTRLRSIALGGAAAALIVAGATSKSFAVEAGTFQYLAGGTIGIPVGAAAPPGLYTGVTYWESPFGGMTGNQGGTLPASQTAHGIGLGANAAVVPLVWSTGWQFLGASYSVAAIQPFVLAIVGTANGIPYGTNAGTTCSAATSFCAWQYITINTVWQPMHLSWNLGNGWFTSVYFNFQAEDGTRTLGSANPDYWTLAPGAAISYLSGSWNASLNLVYQIYGKSSGANGAGLAGTPWANGYTNGDQFAGDWHILYKMGKWSFGPVGYFVEQTTADVAGYTGCAGLAASPHAGNGCANQDFVGVGGLVGYDFGPVDLQVWATDTVWSQNTAEAGWVIWTRLGFRLWAPEAPKPMVAKN